MNDINNLIAALESKVDMLETELTYINQILINYGFSEGIQTLKTTIEEMLKGFN